MYVRTFFISSVPMSNEAREKLTLARPQTVSDLNDLDYCNSLFRSLSAKNITRLQNIQNLYGTLCLWCV